MAYQRLLIDGYSLLHRDPETKALLKQNLRLAREQLIEKLSRTATALAERVTVVFDGQLGGGSSPGGSQAVEVLYSAAGQTADTVIERLVQTATTPSSWLVVTNDRRERETVMAAGVMTMSCAVFLEECSVQHRQHRQSMLRQSKREPGPRLGDFFPK